MNELFQHCNNRFLTCRAGEISRLEHTFAMPKRCPSPVSKSAQQGAVLLEVILALGLMLFATAVINNGLQSSVDAVERLKYSTHAQNLTVSVISQIHMGLLPMVTTEAQPFTEPFQDWTYEIQAKDFGESPLNSSRPTQVEVIVRHTTLDYTRRMTEVFPPSTSTHLSTLLNQEEDAPVPDETEGAEE